MVIHVNFNFFQALFFDNTITRCIRKGRGCRRYRALPTSTDICIWHTKHKKTLSSPLLHLAFSTSFGKLNNKKYATINSGTKLGSGHTTHTTKSPVSPTTDPVATPCPVPVPSPSPYLGPNEQQPRQVDICAVRN